MITVIGTLQWLVGLGLTYGVVKEVILPVFGG